MHKDKPKGAVEGAEGAICLNGSPGSLKSSLSFVCVVTTAKQEIISSHVRLGEG